MRNHTSKAPLRLCSAARALNSAPILCELYKWLQGEDKSSRGFTNCTCAHNLSSLRDNGIQIVAVLGFHVLNNEPKWTRNFNCKGNNLARFDVNKYGVMISASSLEVQACSLSDYIDINWSLVILILSPFTFNVAFHILKNWWRCALQTLIHPAPPHVNIIIIITRKNWIIFTFTFITPKILN